MRDQDSASRSLVISLKWKALLLTSLVLLIVTILFGGLNYLKLDGDYERRREGQQRQYALQVQNLLDQSSYRLQRTSATVASLESVQGLVRNGLNDAGSAKLDALFANLELNLDIESFLLVGADGQTLASLGAAIRGQGADLMRDAVDKVQRTEMSRGVIDCTDVCLQYAIAPVLGGANGNGALILGVSFADLVLDFQRVSGTDLGLIVEHRSQLSGELAASRWIPEWHASVAALTNAAKNFQVIQEAARTKSQLADLRHPVALGMNGRTMEIRLFPLTGFANQEQAYLFVIADITEALVDIRRSTERTLLVGCLGLVASELLLLLILWAPLSRLKIAASALPELAKGEFVKVRNAISGIRRYRWFRDEVDVLSDMAISLSSQLEVLNAEVALRTRDLSERMREITQERNFVTHLLETAQAIILTQDSDNRILTCNRYAYSVTGYGKDELINRPFLELLGEDDSRDDVAYMLKSLAKGERQHFEVEHDLRGKDGSPINIVWQHSHLSIGKADSAVILSVGMDITARKKAERRLAWLADHDPLTGLFNRRRFEHELEHAIASAKRYGHSGALLFFDLDQFKYVNDTSGHSAGDRLLVKIGESLPRLLRGVDIVGRLGGDEFAVILSRATGDEAIQVTKKILAHIRDTEFSVGERVHKVSASMGIAMFPDHGGNQQDLLTRADLAMYQVKESGRGGWYLLSSDDQSHRIMQERVMWKQRIEHALLESRFVLYVQPIVDIRKATVSHYEVLLRMQGDDDAIFAPFNFIEVAERSGLINTVDRFVLSETIKHLANARDRGIVLRLTVNLSAHAFNDPELVSLLERLLTETSLDPSQLIFEMTETAALADLAAARRLMETIGAIGCQFALDDFGTGFSSFYYLRQLPFEFIKIDGSFIRALADRPDDQVLVKAMGEIARAFHKKSVAEHVEDAQALQLLMDYGIDYAQGFYTGPPVPISSLLDEDQSLPKIAVQGNRS